MGGSGGGGSGGGGNINDVGEVTSSSLGNVKTWSCEEVAIWLESLGLSTTYNGLFGFYLFFC
jgi:hypothetical protein